MRGSHRDDGEGGRGVGSEIKDVKNQRSAPGSTCWLDQVEPDLARSSQAQGTLSPISSSQRNAMHAKMKDTRYVGQNEYHLVGLAYGGSEMAGPLLTFLLQVAGTDDATHVRLPMHAWKAGFRSRGKAQAQEMHVAWNRHLAVFNLKMSMRQSIMRFPSVSV